MEKSNKNIRTLYGNSFNLENSTEFEYRNKWNLNPENNIIEQFPLHLDIEITNYCNLKCSFCASTIYNYEKKGFMKLDVFKKIIDESARKGLYALKLNWRGEPLLNNNIIEMVKYAKQSGIHDVFMNTNGYYLTEGISRELIYAGLDRIIFSFEGNTKEVYEKYRIGSNFERVTNNIRKFCEIRNSINSKKPIIRVQTVKVPELCENETVYKEYWKDIADEITIIDIRDEKKDFTGIYDQNWKCPYLWIRLTISFDGNVYPCCFVTKGDENYDGSEKIGNVLSNSIESIWKSKIMNDLRDFHINGCINKIDLCSKCSFRGTDITKNILL